ncbi:MULTISPECIES: SPFH domain-containing protein [Aeromicrobium]|nr:MULTISPECIES: SPFH domain-containing protein [Aeromicrobium]
MNRLMIDGLQASVTDSLGPSPAGWALVALVLVVGAVLASMRVVPEHQRLVVTRLGRVVRVAGPGLVRRVPGLERWTTISLRPTSQMLGVAATTLDGISVHVRASTQVHVTDPARAVVAADDPIAATFAALEAHLGREIACTRFADLLVARQRFESDLPTLTTGVTSAWGVEVISLDVGDVEALLTADLLRAVDGDVRAR